MQCFICASDCRACTTNLQRNEERNMEQKWVWIIFLAPLGIAIFITIGGEVVLQLWNWLLPSLFGWRQITFWQAVGLLALCRILFGGSGGRGFHRFHFR